MDCRQNLFLMPPKKAPEYGEGLDPLEEDHEELTGHQWEDERPTSLVSAPSTSILYLTVRYFFKHGILHVSVAGTGHL